MVLKYCINKIKLKHFQSYPGGTGIAAYNPIKLDLGGVVLGTLVGIGAIIIIPKLLNAFHGGYGGYGRSKWYGKRKCESVIDILINCFRWKW